MLGRGVFYDGQDDIRPPGRKIPVSRGAGFSRNDCLAIRRDGLSLSQSDETDAGFSEQRTNVSPQAAQNSAVPNF